MIGVFAKPHERVLVEEFFQLFKTPWELFEPGKSYDVVLTTGNHVRPIAARLVLVYSSSATEWDSEARTTRQTPGNPFVRFEDEIFPVYGELCSFDNARVCVATLDGSETPVAIQSTINGATLIRIGYDLFSEVSFLLSQGQPAENAPYPVLDQHIAVLRQLMVAHGIPVIEIPPAPCGTRFIACLTHDIDFLSLRQHTFDRTMWGFLFRATVGSAQKFAAGKIGAGRLGTNLLAAARLPFVHLGWGEDCWLPFERYVETDHRPSTFFLVPAKNRDGHAPNGKSSAGRATRYDIGDVTEWIPLLRRNGCETGLHGIDAWHDVESARTERERFSSIAAEDQPGVRMHWLYFSGESPRILEEAGFDYDATCGYNEAVGFRAGTGQVFKPPGANRLLELPFQIQDTALFYSDRMNLSEREAWAACQRVLESTRKHGGVLTLSWHDRSLAPERLWGDFYSALLKEVEAAAPWFGTAKQIVGWFRQRRAVRFDEVKRFEDRIEVSLRNVPAEAEPDFAVRISWLDADGRPTETELPLGCCDRITFDLSSNTKAQRSSCVIRRERRELSAKETA